MRPEPEAGWEFYLVAHVEPFAAAWAFHADQKAANRHDSELCPPEALAIVIEQHWAA
jgi:hypothetical protein